MNKGIRTQLLIKFYNFYLQGEASRQTALLYFYSLVMNTLKEQLFKWFKKTFKLYLILPT